GAHADRKARPPGRIGPATLSRSGVQRGADFRGRRGGCRIHDHELFEQREPAAARGSVRGVCLARAHTLSACCILRVASGKTVSATTSDRRAPASDLGNLLRYWRDVRGVSQLDLSLEAGVSQRQISFIESGRSVPGRDTLLTLAQTLDVPLRERNALLLAAGYAPIYSEAPWNAQEMHGVIRALERVVRQHEPYPAIVMDRHWNVLMTNDAAPGCFNWLIERAAGEGPGKMVHLMFDPHGMRPFVADWETVARSLLQRVYRESVGRVIDGDTGRLLDELLAYPDVPRDWK